MFLKLYRKCIIKKQIDETRNEKHGSGTRRVLTHQLRYKMRAVVVACHVRVKAPLALSDPRHRSNMLADYPHDVSVEFDDDVYTQSLRAFYHNGSIALLQ